MGSPQISRQFTSPINGKIKVQKDTGSASRVDCRDQKTASTGPATLLGRQSVDMDTAQTSSRPATFLGRQSVDMDAAQS